MKANFILRHPVLKDVMNILLFLLLVSVGTVFINSYVFRTFNVIGPSMEKTLATDDRLIVNRIPVTLARLKNETYVPERGKIIVFKNPLYATMLRDEYIVKRVIAFEGEIVSLTGGKFTVKSSDKPEGFNPDDYSHGEPLSPTEGQIENFVVPKGEIFVSGDNRLGSYSLDSRNGLGTVPLYDIVGPVSLRIYPFNKIRGF